MHQDTAVLADAHALQEFPGLLKTRRKVLCRVVTHGNALVAEIRILLMVVQNATVISRGCAIEDVPDVVFPQANNIPCVIGVTNPYPVKVLVLEMAHSLVLLYLWLNCVMVALSCLFFGATLVAVLFQLLLLGTLLRAFRADISMRHFPRRAAAPHCHAWPVGASGRAEKGGVKK
eukprot:CAMPEP_0179272084 /NCGR_PEP_ID=MMETSP0797-20121207/32312_1 /TAXON_ID=47934 /ORGANISM="Dinophysis acuminata, Strain DAEP01" /LENGTH=174 /DNA_ID=CAMNT_0020980463 /DNA_START=266 /DNA_END=787 /DNA_ORIENTATION=+